MPDSDDQKAAIVRLQERMDRYREMIERLDKQAERTELMIQTLAHNVNKIVWTLGIFGALAVASETGFLPSLVKILAGAR